MDDLLQDFIAETRETLETLSGEIVAWEAAPGDRARLDAIFRFVHTVKGSCGFLDLPRLQRLSHAAEDVLAQVRDGHRTPDQQLVNAVLGIVDRIAEIVEAIDAGTALDHSGEDLLIAALEDGSAEVHHAAPVQVRPASRSVRLSVDLLDRMMGGMSDMVLARNELARRLRDSDCDPAIEAALERMSATVADMRDAVTLTRMQKLDALFSPLPRVVRDTAASLGKAVSLSIDGADVELDREMIEAMRDPLVHIIRNSIDHGIEFPADRRKAGKPENGRLTVAARQSGNQIVMEIIDDGRGIDVERVIRKLAENGSRSEAELRKLPDQAKLALIFEPGLSTKDAATEVSGRGVGMDVVRASVDQIGGRIELDNSPGKGLRITIHLPLTLSIISAVTLGVGNQSFALPRQAVEEIVSAGAQNIRVDQLGSASIATVRGRKLPLVRLCDVLRIESSGHETAGMLVIVGMGTGSYALAVDTVFDTEELVIKPAVPQIMASGVYGGQTLPDSGQPMLLLDGAGIAARANVRFGINGAFTRSEEEAEVEEDLGMPALMFLDLDGSRRSIPLSVVDRIEKARAEAVAMSAGRLRIAIDGSMITVAVTGDLPPRGSIALLRLNCGDGEIAYAVREAFDIVHVRDEMTPGEQGPVAGVMLVEGEQIEMIDPNWLFEQFGPNEAAHDASPICLLAGADDGWMRNFVKPLLESAGYRAVFKLEAGQAPAVVLAREGETPDAAGTAPLVHLSDRRGGGADRAGIFRYDRAALLGAVAERLRTI
ncbi:chemotaxis protein CheA [Stakelama sp. CBK3Z-3]|uniref:Chemotaxis protein CheA n=1 Tax=Stakelama flava TaxID=2860338 RepID=A0ABS6XH77_9SPHN|nr:chemotaxis protein CheA [Stakelama flava]MBW4329496.1 chemotaxis protein CheA [Stakelama flava]